MDKSLAKGMPVDKCAKIYMNAIYRKKRSVLIGRGELMGAHFKRFWPWFFYKFIGKFSTT